MDNSLSARLTIEELSALPATVMPALVTIKGDDGDLAEFPDRRLSLLYLLTVESAANYLKENKVPPAKGAAIVTQLTALYNLTRSEKPLYRTLTVTVEDLPDPLPKADKSGGRFVQLKGDDGELHYHYLKTLPTEGRSVEVQERIGAEISKELSVQEMAAYLARGFLQADFGEGETQIIPLALLTPLLDAVNAWGLEIVKRIAKGQPIDYNRAIDAAKQWLTDLPTIENGRGSPTMQPEDESGSDLHFQF